MPVPVSGCLDAPANIGDETLRSVWARVVTTIPCTGYFRPYEASPAWHTVNAVRLMDTELDIQRDTTVESPEDHAYRRARERAEMIQGLYIHLLVFAAINAGLFALNWVTRAGGGSWWFQWPLLIWGIGLIIHILVTIAPVFSPQWVERRTQQMLSRRDNRTG